MSQATLTPDTSDKNVLTYSALNTFRNCPRKYKHRYVDNLRPRMKAESLSFGSVIILYGDSVAKKDATGNVTIERVVRTKPHPTYEAGDRTGRLPELLPLDYEQFVKAFNSPARGSETGTSSVAKSSTPASTLSGKAK